VGRFPLTVMDACCPRIQWEPSSNKSKTRGLPFTFKSNSSLQNNPETSSYLYDGRE